jgi:hypothetical protein
MKIKRFNQYNEGKKEDEMLDQLLDKGIENLTPKEKELLTHLSKGGKLEEEKPKPEKDDVFGTGFGTDTGVMDSPKPKSKFKEGDKITYRKAGSPHDGKNGWFQKVREDGKYSLLFDAGFRFAANPKNVFPYNKDLKALDPYDEEDWNNKGGRDDSWVNVAPNNTPANFYYHAQNFDGDVVVAMTSVGFFNANHALDDSLGAHSLSNQVKHAMEMAGVFSQVELQEAMFEGLPGFTAEQINENMEQAGFNHGQEFIDFMNAHN